MSRQRDDNDEPTGRDLDALVAEEPDPEDLPPVEGEDEDVVEDDEPEEETADDPDAEVEDDAESDLEAAFAEEAELEVPAPEAAPKAPARTSKANEPFKTIRLRVDGQEVELPTSKEGIYNGERVRILSDADWSYLHSRLRDPAALRRQQQEHQRQLAERDPERNPITIRARVWMSELNKIIQPLVEKGDTAPLQEWVENAQLNAMRLQMLAEQEIGKAQQARVQQQQNEEELERQAAEWVPRLERSLSEGIAQILAQPEYKGLGLNAQALKQNYWEIRGELFFEADATDAATYGVAEGTLMLNTQRLQQLIEPARQAALAVSRKNPAARRAKLNASAAGKSTAPVKKAAAVVRRGGTATSGTAAAPEKKKFSSKEEWEQHLYNEARR